MDQQDVDQYFVARRKHTFALCAGALSVLLLGVALALHFMGIRGQVLGTMLLLAMVGVQMAMAAISEARRTLLTIIERQINRSPEALTYIAGRSRHQRPIVPSIT